MLGELLLLLLENVGDVEVQKFQGLLQDIGQNGSGCLVIGGGNLDRQDDPVVIHAPDKLVLIVRDLLPLRLGPEPKPCRAVQTREGESGR